MSFAKLVGAALTQSLHWMDHDGGKYCLSVRVPIHGQLVTIMRKENKLSVQNPCRNRVTYFGIEIAGKC